MSNARRDITAEWWKFAAFCEHLANAVRFTTDQLLDVIETPWSWVDEFEAWESEQNWHEEERVEPVWLTTRNGELSVDSSCFGVSVQFPTMQHEILATAGEAEQLASALRSAASESRRKARR